MKLLRVWLGLAAGAWLIAGLKAADAPSKPTVRINLDEPAKPAPVPAPKKAAPSPPPAAPAANSGKAEPAKKADVPPPKIEGIEVPRVKGGFLGVALVGGAFKISFYDAERKSAAADVDSASLRWPVNYKNGGERINLPRGSDGRSLTSPFQVRPPHSFRLSISLFVEGKTDAVESYSIQFHE